MAGVVLVSGIGCAHTYHALHYNHIARALHEHPRSYYHSEHTGRIIPKDVPYCPVELPCFGYEPTCWLPWPADCPKCPVVETIIQGQIPHEPIVPGPPHDSIVTEPPPPPSALPNEPAVEDIPSNQSEAPPLPDSTQNSGPAANDSVQIRIPSMGPPMVIEDSAPLIRSNPVATSPGPILPPLTPPSAQPSADRAVAKEATVDVNGPTMPQIVDPVEMTSEDGFDMPPADFPMVVAELPTIELDDSRPPDPNTTVTPPQIKKPGKSSRRKRPHSRPSTGAPMITGTAPDQPPAQPLPTVAADKHGPTNAITDANVTGPQRVAEVSEPGDEISRVLGSMPAKADSGLTVPSFPIAARKPIDQTDANAPPRIQRVTEATIRFVGEQTSDIRVSDSSAKPGSSEIRYR
jgi:hypothetical protein